jgi:cyanophycin synthetase
MHLSPTEGRARDVAAAMLDSLYPPGAPSRIPVISVTGTNGKTSTARMISQVLQQAGTRVGVACTDGVYVGGRLVYAADASGPRSAEMVLDDPTVEAAVLETARGGIVRRGLGYDRADVAVVTNIAADHLGDDGIEDLDELIHVKALVAEEICDGGSVVLNADDQSTAAMVERPAVRAHAPVIRLFSVVPDNPVLARHKAAGGACYEVIDGQLTETVGGEQRFIVAATDLPGTFDGRAAHVMANALAAIAACRAVGVSAKDIARALTTFAPSADNPGRATVFKAGQTPVIVDYGHNAAALDTTGRLVRDVWPGEPVAAVTLPGDRRDDLLVASAQAIARSFPAVVLYEDSDKRGRRTGEMLTLVGAALREARPGIVCRSAENPADALRAALELATDGPVLFVYEKLALAMDALAAVGAVPWPDAGRTRTQPTMPGTGPSESPDAAEAAVASATAVVAGAAHAAEAAVADATAVVADAAAAAITDAADAALLQPRMATPTAPAQRSASTQPTPAPAPRTPAPAPATPPAADRAGHDNGQTADGSADYFL